MDRALRIAENGLDFEGGKGVLPARCALADDDRSSLARRSADIASRLRPAGHDGVLPNIAKLFVGLNRRAEGAEDEAERMMIYVETLANAPAWALAAVTADYVAGRRGDRRWLPTAAEMAAACDDLTVPLVRERMRIGRVLNAKILPEPAGGENRAAVLAKIAAATTEMRARDPLRPKPPAEAPEAPERALERLAAMPAPAMSAGLAASLGLRAKEGDAS